MKYGKLSERTADLLILLWATLGLVLFGILGQRLGNELDDGAFTHSILRYWFQIVAISGGGVLVWKVLKMVSCRYPEIYQRVRMLLLTVLLGFNSYVTVRTFSDFRPYSTDLSQSKIYWDAFGVSKLFGQMDGVEKVLPDLFWRWENDAVLPALSLGYGLLAVLGYLLVCWMWLYYALRCVRYLQSDTELGVSAGGERIWRLDATRLVYFSSVLPLVPKLFGQLLPMLGLPAFSGGIPFFSADVAILSLDLTEVGILQLITMAYLLCQPRLPKEKTEEVAEESQKETAVETKKAVTMEDFQQAEYVYFCSDWDEESFPYFYVYAGWYYLTRDMAQPECMEEGKSLYIGKDDFLKQIHPATPEKGICHMWE